jgi:DNA-binding GntR family transcriptional regulator
MKAQSKNKPVNLTARSPKDMDSNEEKVYSAIYDAVMDHRLPPGTKLTESTFSEYFHVSRTVIRKALFRLAQKNIAELRPNRGAIVARPSIEETRDVFNARRIIETATIAEVILSIDKDQIKKLKNHLKEEEAAHKNKERRTIVRLSGEFHTLLASMQPNQVLYEYVSDLVSRTTLIVALYESPGSPGCTNHDHLELVNYIAAKDGTNAVKAMNEHLKEIEDNLNLEETTDEISLEDVFNVN